MTAEEAIETMAENVNEVADIVVAVEVLAGAALMKGDRRLYEHLYKAIAMYKDGVDLGWSKFLK